MKKLYFYGWEGHNNYKVSADFDTAIVKAFELAASDSGMTLEEFKNNYLDGADTELTDYDPYDYGIDFIKITVDESELKQLLDEK